MPHMHLGVYLTSGEEASNAVKWAIEVYLSPKSKLWKNADANQAGYRAYVSACSQYLL